MPQSNRSLERLAPFAMPSRLLLPRPFLYALKIPITRADLASGWMKLFNSFPLSAVTSAACLETFCFFTERREDLRLQRFKASHSGLKEALRLSDPTVHKVHSIMQGLRIDLASTHYMHRFLQSDTFGAPSHKALHTVPNSFHSLKNSLLYRNTRLPNVNVRPRSKHSQLAPV